MKHLATFQEAANVLSVRLSYYCHGDVVCIPRSAGLLIRISYDDPELVISFARVAFRQFIKFRVDRRRIRYVDM